MEEEKKIRDDFPKMQFIFLDGKTKEEKELEIKELLRKRDELLKNYGYDKSIGTAEELPEEQQSKSGR